MLINNVLHPHYTFPAFKSIYEYNRGAGDEEFMVIDICAWYFENIRVGLLPALPSFHQSPSPTHVMQMNADLSFVFHCIVSDLFMIYVSLYSCLLIYLFPQIASDNFPYPQNVLDYQTVEEQRFTRREDPNYIAGKDIFSISISISIQYLILLNSFFTMPNLSLAWLTDHA